MGMKQVGMRVLAVILVEDSIYTNSWPTKLLCDASLCVSEIQLTVGPFVGPKAALVTKRHRPFVIILLHIP